MPHIHCFGYTLNLAVNRALEVQQVSAIVRNCGKTVPCFEMSSKRSNKLQDVETQQNIEQLQLLQDVDTTEQ